MTTFLVTGASRGLGIEFVRQLLGKDGFKVVACCRNPESATELNKLKSSAGDRLSVHKLDVNDEDSIKASVEEISKYATNGIDVLINNAGVGGNTAGLSKM
ncbi:NAD(P)-binding protein [Basidiobolus meristosporus CBS 931.73]|uniref:NAD(P)-binding protein n=1 Tax=Basidiobolus meristosporus CBS 931.73 TaxID=1314790 RepID=A0A1Y1Z938_9FUNG|nr:NAD(P)-binding protein [Basidiobolus meristosporus CBS 931.73]|eukprot:ORY06792.1 NAD(P)-binding protein [Basidiobolus meristosporus CBS 931.73]